MNLRPLILATLIAVMAPTMAAAQRAVILVRHAEKADTPPDDPPLTEAGRARAAKLVSMLRDSGVGAIYSTSFLRTRSTAEGVASALKLPVGDMPSSIDAFVALLRSRHAGDVVLVVGHSNTVPEILQRLGVEKAPAIPDSEYDNLFVAMPGQAGGAWNALRLRY